MKDKKTVQKSIRMTETISQYIEAVQGNGFNEKFENLVLYLIENNNLKNEIECNKQTIQTLNYEIAQKKKILGQLSVLDNLINELLNTAKGNF